MFTDLKLANQMDDVASLLQNETEELFSAIEYAIEGWDTIPRGKRIYKRESDQDAVDMGVDDLDYAVEMHRDAVKQVERMDKYLRKLLQLRKQFGDETGFHFQG